MLVAAEMFEHDLNWVQLYHFFGWSAGGSIFLVYSLTDQGIVRLYSDADAESPHGFWVLEWGGVLRAGQ